jgi:transglutaminase-like putative cysteine protease
MLTFDPVRMQYQVDLRYQVNSPGSDFIFNVQAARTRQQLVLWESLTVNQGVQLQEHCDPATSGRFLRLRATSGELALRYAALVEQRPVGEAPGNIPETWIPDLPGEVLPYLYPSRFCESDLLAPVALAHFGALWQGYSRVEAICAWVNTHVKFASGSSCSTTTASQTLASGRGVCRDFAHLMIALCRALNIPARFVTGFDYGADPALGPSDFHAYVEAYLGGRWYIFDPSGTAIPMGFMRLTSGRDAADCAYASIFGDVLPLSRTLQISAASTSPGLPALEPYRVSGAISTAVD